MVKLKGDRIILFGPPGVGKSTIARELEKLGYHYYEGDFDLFTEVRALNSQNKGLSEDLRKRQNEFICHKIVELTKKHRRLVVAYDFMWDRYRRYLRSLNSELRWIYLTTTPDVLRKRVDRPGHLLTPEFAISIYDRFEPPSFPVVVINTHASVDAVVTKILG